MAPQSWPPWKVLEEEPNKKKKKRATYKVSSQNSAQKQIQTHVSTKITWWKSKSPGAIEPYGATAFSEGARIVVRLQYLVMVPLCSKRKIRSQTPGARFDPLGERDMGRGWVEWRVPLIHQERAWWLMKEKGLCTWLAFHERQSALVELLQLRRRTVLVTVKRCWCWLWSVRKQKRWESWSQWRGAFSGYDWVRSHGCRRGRCAWVKGAEAADTVSCTSWACDIETTVTDEVNVTMEEEFHGKIGDGSLRFIL